MSQLKTFGAVILLGILGCGTALRCFVCNSHYHKECTESPVPDKYLVTCDAATHLPLEPSGNEHSQNRKVRVSTAEGVNFTSCRKVVTKIPQQDNGVLVLPETTRTIRSCGYVRVQKDRNQCKWAGNHGVQMYMCECEKDSCNSAPNKFIPAVIYLVIVCFFAIILSK